MTIQFRKDLVTHEVAGEALSVGHAVYKSDGTDSRTAGKVYKLEIYTANRDKFYGVCKQDVAADASVKIVQVGRIPKLSSMTITQGKVIYASTSVAGAYQTTSSAQAIGVAVDADTLVINPALASELEKTYKYIVSFNAGIKNTGILALDTENNASSGTNITLATPTKAAVRLTTGGLNSIQSITAPASIAQYFILINVKGSPVTIVNGTGNILTGTGVDLVLEDDASIALMYDTNDGGAWRVVGGSGSGGGLTQIDHSITVAEVSSFSTGVSGTPILTAKFWDDSEGMFLELSPASLTLDVSLNGQDIDYDTTSFVFDTDDYIVISAYYNQSISSTFYDSGWVLVSAINDTPAVGYHRVDLPSGFVDHPESFSVLINDTTNIYPADYASTLIFDVNAGTYRITFETTGLASTSLFRIRARA